MKINYLFFAFVLLFIVLQKKSVAQDQPLPSKKVPAKTIRTIPHRTAREKLMWPHRVFALEVTKEKKINYDTNYIKSYRRSLTITLPLSTRFLKFSIVRRDTCFGIQVNNTYIIEV